MRTLNEIVELTGRNHFDSNIRLTNSDRPAVEGHIYLQESYFHRSGSRSWWPLHDSRGCFDFIDDGLHSRVDDTTIPIVGCGN